jgi:RNA polymerase sigma-70 factor (ECF subfamily)
VEVSAASFQDLVVAQIPRLRRYAYALTGDRSQGDDLVQECLERAWGRRRLYEASRPIRPWLFTILHNLHVNQVRRRAAEPTMVSHDDPASGEPAAPGEPGEVEVEDLRRALVSLAPAQREVVLLVGVEQLSYREAAAALGVPVGTVMSRLSRGRAQLRELLAGRDAAPGRKPR